MRLVLEVEVDTGTGTSGREASNWIGLLLLNVAWTLLREGFVPTTKFRDDAGRTCGSLEVCRNLGAHPR